MEGMRTTYSEQAGEWTKAVLSKHGIASARQAEIRTRGKVSYATIQSMLNGKAPSEALVIKFADAFKENIAESLRVCGYVDMAELWEQKTTPEVDEEQRYQRSSTSKGDLMYEAADDDEREVLSFYRDTPPEMKSATKAAMKALRDSRPSDPEASSPIGGKRVGNGFELDRHKLPDGWKRSETCGIIDKIKIHPEVEKHLRGVFARPDLAQRLAAWEADSRNAGEDRQSLYAQRDAMRDDLRKLEEQRQRAIDLAIDGTITKLDLQARHNKNDRDKAALESRLQRLQAKLEAPAVAPAALQMLESVLQYKFEDLWYDDDILTDHQRALIAQAILDHIPVTGIKHDRVFGNPVFSFWL